MLDLQAPLSEMGSQEIRSTSGGWVSGHLLLGSGTAFLFKPSLSSNQGPDAGEGQAWVSDQSWSFCVPGSHRGRP